MTTVTRYHDFSTGHRVHGHENKCAHLHGHNYRVYFTCTGELDRVGRVLDFSKMKTILCDWLENNWDHKFLAWDQDEFMRLIVPSPDRFVAIGDVANDASQMLLDSIVWVPFNPTAENMADHLLRVVGPKLLWAHAVKLVKVKVWETRKCFATAELEGES